MTDGRAPSPWSLGLPASSQRRPGTRNLRQEPWVLRPPPLSRCRGAGGREGHRRGWWERPGIPLPVGSLSTAGPSTSGLSTRAGRGGVRPGVEGWVGPRIISRGKAASVRFWLQLRRHLWFSLIFRGWPGAQLFADPRVGCGGGPLARRLRPPALGGRGSPLSLLEGALWDDARRPHDHRLCGGWVCCIFCLRGRWRNLPLAWGGDEGWCRATGSTHPDGPLLLSLC